MYAYFTNIWDRMILWRVIGSYKSRCKQEEPSILKMGVVRKGGMRCTIFSKGITVRPENPLGGLCSCFSVLASKRAVTIVGE